MNVRSIIVEALNRSNVVPRRQPAPGDKVQDGLNLLLGIASKYNNDNYLAFTQCTVDIPARRYIHIYDQDDTGMGEHNMIFETRDLLLLYQPTDEDFMNQVYAMAKDSTNTYFRVIRVGDVNQWFEVEHPDEYDQRYQQMKRYCETYHIHVKEVAKLNSLFVNRGNTYGMLRLHFVPRADFAGFVANELLWTWTEGAEGEWFIETKPYVSNNAAKLSLSYNRALKFDLDSDLRIPDAYIELLTVALTHKLALKFPRVDDAQMQRLENDVTVMLDNVRTPKADAKQVLREDGWGDCSGTFEGVLQGRMFL